MTRYLHAETGWEISLDTDDATPAEIETTYYVDGFAHDSTTRRTYRTLTSTLPSRTPITVDVVTEGDRVTVLPQAAEFTASDAEGFAVILTVVSAYALTLTERN